MDIDSDSCYVSDLSTTGGVVMSLKFSVWIAVLIASAYGAGYSSALDMDGWLIFSWLAVFGSAFVVGWMKGEV